MSKHRFRLLAIAMIRRGVALRHARRAALELECHHRELVEEALGRGETSEQAQRSADEALGSDPVLIERYASQRELRSWAYRWRAGYVLAPLLGFAAAFAGAILLLVTVAKPWVPALRHVSNPGALDQQINVVFSMLLLWLIPAAIATGFGALAGRQHIALRWLSAGIVVLSICATLMNVQVALAGGSPHGSIGAGIGFNTTHLPRDLLHVLALVALSLIPAAWLRHRVMSREPTLE
ncbi:MAG TPA: hypothetical protein VGR92_23575 [Steroidobacteraceae bacterium]|nr:hypothetical protein [Steroidobacteraceae bacterium]